MNIDYQGKQSTRRRVVNFSQLSSMVATDNETDAPGHVTVSHEHDFPISRFLLSHLARKSEAHADITTITPAAAVQRVS